jgi:hypothetical protein
MTQLHNNIFDNTAGIRVAQLGKLSWLALLGGLCETWVQGLLIARAVHRLLQQMAGA